MALRTLWATQLENLSLYLSSLRFTTHVVQCALITETWFQVFLFFSHFLLTDNLSIKNQFYLPLQRNFAANSSNDAGYDQGYASERSPEDELPPTLPLIDEQQRLQSMQAMEHYLHEHPQHQEQSQQDTMMPYNYNLNSCLEYTQLYQYDFITKGKCRCL